MGPRRQESALPQILDRDARRAEDERNRRKMVVPIMTIGNVPAILNLAIHSKKAAASTTNSSEITESPIDVEDEVERWGYVRSTFTNNAATHPLAYYIAQEFWNRRVPEFRCRCQDAGFDRERSGMVPRTVDR